MQHHGHQHIPAPPPPPYYQPRPRRNPLLIPLILVSVLAGVMTVLYALTFMDTARPNLALTHAVEACPASDYITVVDEGTALIITTEGTESYGASINDMACVLTELDMPLNIINRLDTTRALDGTQTGSWAEYDASWNYHPDSGLNLTITLVNN